MIKINTTKNLFSLGLVQGLNYLIPLITVPYLTRVLGPKEYGLIGFTYAIVQYFSLIIDYGFNLSATRLVAQDPNNLQKNSSLYWSVLFCKCILFILSAILLVIVVVSNDSLMGNLKIVAASFISVVGNILLPTWLFQGKEKIGWLAITNSITRIVIVSFIFVFVKSPDDAWLAAFFTSISFVIASVFSVISVYRKKWIVWIRVDSREIIEQFKTGAHCFISTISISLYTTAIPIVLGFIAGAHSVGIYVAADKIRIALQGFINPISQTFYPKINSLMINNKNKAYKIIRTILITQSSILLLLGALVYFNATLIVEKLFGYQYLESVSILKLLCWIPFLIGISNALGVQTLLVLGRSRDFTWVLIKTSLLSVFYLIPLVICYKETGSAISVMVTEFLVVLFMLLAIKRNNIPLFVKEINNEKI